MKTSSRRKRPRQKGMKIINIPNQDTAQIGRCQEVQVFFIASPETEW
jgi:hypothetical protein